MKHFKKLKSSAIIIALVIGMIISIVMIGTSLLIGQRLQVTAQSRQGKLAYRAALSGIEDGLMLIKQSRAQNQLENIINKSLSGQTLIPQTSENRKIYYDLNILSGSISSFPEIYSSLSPTALSSFLSRLGLDNAVSSIGETNIEKFSKLNADDLADIDISSDFDISTLDIYFSKPHYYDALMGKPKYFTGYFTPLSVKLIDASKEAEKQLVYEYTVENQTVSKVSIPVAKINLCKTAGKCKLKIKPQTAKKGTKFSGKNAETKSSKYIYYALVARDSGNNLIGYDDTEPGVVTIESTGYAGQAARKLQARVDVASGAYLGIFDFGIYCGDKCVGRGIDEL